MKIHATINQEVNINPIYVIRQLIDDTIGHDSWVFKEESKYFKGYTVGAGCRSIDERVEITKEKYEYIKALKLIEKTLTLS